MEITALAAFAPVKKALDVYRYLMTGEVRQWKDAGVVFGSWVLGTALAYLVTGSTFAGDIGLVLETWQDHVLAGITLGSLAGVFADLSQPTGVTIR